jgi:acid phosphatase (class A)
MSLINNVSAILNSKIPLDDVVYLQNKPSYEDDLSILDVNWKTIIPPPPKNSSNQTARELKVVYQAVVSRTAREVELVKIVDQEPLDLFYNFLDKKKLAFPKQTFDEYYNILEQYMYALKNYFNRPRPEQLAPYHNIKLDILYTDTHHTPAYPSGHAMYGALAAHLLSDRYPQYRTQFFELAKYCGYARILQGVHYPSDNKVAFKATEVLFNSMKRRFEDEEKRQKFPVDRQS